MDATPISEPMVSTGGMVKTSRSTQKEERDFKEEWLQAIRQRGFEIGYLNFFGRYPQLFE